MSTVQCVSGAAFVLAAVVGAQPALAAGGWYLLIPPRSDHDILKILDTEPLSKWTQQGAYDSASECEAVKNSLLTVERNSYSDAMRRHGGEKDSAKAAVIQHAAENYDANAEGLAASRCVKSDDARLGK